MKGSKMPFGEFDLAKMFEMPKQMGDFKFAPLDMEGLVAAQRKNMEALAQANQLAVESFQAVARRQSEIFRSVLEEASVAAREVMAAGSPEEKAAKQADLMIAEVMGIVPNLGASAQAQQKASAQGLSDYELIGLWTAANAEGTSITSSGSSSPTFTCGPQPGDKSPAC
jgi:hypothetical protein